MYIASTETAVHHYADWSAWNWAAWTIALLIALGALHYAMSTAVSEWGSIAITPPAVIAAIWAVVWVPYSLYQLLRHCSTGQGALSVALLTAAAVVCIVLVNAGNRTSDAAVAITFLALTAIIWVVDGLNRVASWVPTTVGTLVVVAIVGVVAVCTQTADQRR